MVSLPGLLIFLSFETSICDIQILSHWKSTCHLTHVIPARADATQPQTKFKDKVIILRYEFLCTNEQTKIKVMQLRQGISPGESVFFFRTSEQTKISPLTMRFYRK